MYRLTHKGCLIASCTGLLGFTAAAHAATEDFETFTTGQSVNSQGGWTVEDEFGNSGELFDEEVVDLGGNKAWRLSNEIASGGFRAYPDNPLC